MHGTTSVRGSMVGLVAMLVAPRRGFLEAWSNSPGPSSTHPLAQQTGKPGCLDDQARGEHEEQADGPLAEAPRTRFSPTFKKNE